MKKIIPFLLLLIATTGCTTVGGAVDLINPLKFVQTGFYPLLIVAELETNLSSIVIDKTEAKVEKFSVNPFDILPERSTIYVMPVVMDVHNQKSFSTYYSGMIENYLLLNRYAVPVKDIEKADYILRADISESPERRIGKNFTNIQMIIMEKNETPVFFTSITTCSTSDRNFYYHPSKQARPVKELTLFGLEEIFKTSLPQAFGLQSNEG